MSKKRRTDLKLCECGLFATASPAHLASRLATPSHTLTIKDLAALAVDLGSYRLFSLVDEKGKPRAIQEPKRDLQNIHARIHTLLSRVKAPDYLHSTVRGRSYVSNAAAHNSAMPTVKIDIKKFFPSITRAAIFNFFEGPLKCRRDVAGLLADLLTYDAHLPTGSAASPIIAYYSVKPMFDEIYQFAKSRNITMTCYVDDMAFSGLKVHSGFLYEVRKIIARHGLKSHKARTFSGTQPKIITGVCNSTGGSRVLNKQHFKIKAGFEKLSKVENLIEKYEILRPLIGRLEAAGQIDASFVSRAKTVRSQFSEVLSVGKTMKKQDSRRTKIK